MYVVGVILLMVAAPLFSIGNDRYIHHVSTPPILLAGKWFVFWSGGIRLASAGLLQLFRPRFTAAGIFGIQSDDPLPFVQELGCANLATGAAGIMSIARPEFVLPIAIVSAIFYGIAGGRHIADRHRSPRQNLVLATDWFVSLVLIGYIAQAVAR